MRSRTGRIAVALCLTLAVASGALAQSRTFKPEDHYRLRSAADVRVSPDGSTVAFVERFIDAQHRIRSHIWLLTLADGKLKRLSEGSANDSAPHWSPDGRSIAFLTGRASDAANPASTGFLPTAFGSGLAGCALDTGKTDVVARVHGHEPSAGVSGLGGTDRVGTGWECHRVPVGRRRPRRAAWRSESDHPVRVQVLVRHERQQALAHLPRHARRQEDAAADQRDLPGSLDRVLAEGGRDRLHFESRAGPRSRPQLRHLRGQGQRRPSPPGDDDKGLRVRARVVAGRVDRSPTWLAFARSRPRSRAPRTRTSG